jgi:hypothetical protein
VRAHGVRFAGMIEIVSMLVVAQKNRIDLSDLCCRARWCGELLQGDMRKLVSARWVECRIGE